ncbi:MAG: gamma-glutamylcyclotransferase [Burkholderiales bacterium]|nr:gamma-glutamylcyclotransferase [Opitutaceae bacterium]
MDAPRPHLVFVYGTLKRGGSNHALLAGQTYVGPARLAPGHALYSLGEYPGLVADPASPDRVTGEIWAVDTAGLAALDELEGLAQGLYARVPAVLDQWPDSLTAGSRHAAAQVYVYLRAITGRPRLGDTWPI